jgi:Fuc2NAc and GlcNAc transferase
MIVQIFLIIAVFLLSLVTTWVVMKIAIRRSIIDLPNERSSHTDPTPRGGGLAIAISWYLYLAVSYFLGIMELRLLLSLLPGCIIIIISLYDDVKGLPPYLRILVHFGAAALGLFFLGGLNHIDFGTNIVSLSWMLNIFILVGIVWLINLFNFLDGIDGYLGSEAVFIFGILAFLVSDFSALVFAICVLGFLFWNWPKAKIFCGDVGSTLIGYTLAIFAIYYQNTSRLSLLFPVMLSGLFWIDATVTLIRRIRNGEKLSRPHRKHAYQRLCHSGLSHQHVLLLGLGINCVLLVLSLIGIRNIQYLPLLFLAHILVVLLFIKYADKKKKFERFASI